jgi:type IV secretory pathway protease TraF
MDQSINKVEYFKNGVKYELKEIKSVELNKNILGLFNDSEQVISLIVTEEFISEFKKNNEGIEVTFDELTTLKSKELGSYRIRKLLIPISSKNVGNENPSFVIIFVANEKGYITGPLGCPNGYKYIRGIKKSLNID